MDSMASTDLSADRQEQKRKLLKAKIAVALHDELGRVPKEDEINRVFLLNLLSAPLTILLICCHINSFRRVSPSNEAMAGRRKEDRRVDISSHGF